MRSKFGERLDDKLIELVKTNPILYQVNHKDYKSNEKKDDVWKLIGAYLQKDKKECRTRWRTIRDSYRKMKIKNIQALSSGELQSNSKYNADKLKFLDENFQEGSYLGSQIDPATQDGSSQDFVREETEEEDINTSNIKIEIEDTEFNDFKDQSDEVGSSKSNINIADSPTIHSITARPPAKKRKLNEDSILYGTKENPIETFFKSMAATVMTFPPAIIAETRMKVCDLISTMELRALKEEREHASLHQRYVSYSNQSSSNVLHVSGHKVMSGNRRSYTDHSETESDSNSF